MARKEECPEARARVRDCPGSSVHAVCRHVRREARPPETGNGLAPKRFRQSRGCRLIPCCRAAPDHAPVRGCPEVFPDDLSVGNTSAHHPPPPGRAPSDIRHKVCNRIFLAAPSWHINAGGGRLHHQGSMRPSGRFQGIGYSLARPMPAASRSSPSRCAPRRLARAIDGKRRRLQCRSGSGRRYFRCRSDAGRLRCRRPEREG